MLFRKASSFVIGQTREIISSLPLDELLRECITQRTVRYGGIVGEYCRQCRVYRIILQTQPTVQAVQHLVIDDIVARRVHLLEELLGLIFAQLNAASQQCRHELTLRQCAVSVLVVPVM